MRRHVLAAAGLLLVAACGSGGATSDGTPAPSDDAPKASTSLTIVVTPDQGVEPRTYELTCDPAGGDHPQPAEACAALDAAGAAVLAPVPPDQACTEIYGGPQTATVTGTYEGRKVDASFDRTNGCEIDRWEQLGTTFFAVPLQ